MKLSFFRAWLLLPLFAGTLLGQELPKRDGSEPFDFEPKLMLNDVPDLPLPAGAAAATASLSSADVARLEAALERTKTTAARRARLCKVGVLSKVEAEQSALKVVQATLALEQARLQVATQNIEAQRQSAAKGELSADALAAAEAAYATTATNTRECERRWAKAQRAAAELRVLRERKLLAVGAGSRSSVKRAEAALQNLAPPNP
jgi:hypothetical protein